MVSVKTAKGVLIVAGRLDPCANVGTERRYSTVSIPWDYKRFAEVVSKTIRCEIEEKRLLNSYQESSDLQSSEFEELLRKGIGLRIWVIDRLKDKSAFEKIHGMATEEQREKAAKTVDHISMDMTSIDFLWPHENADDQTAIRTIEQRIIMTL